MVHQENVRRVAHIVISLDIGGLEMLVCRIAKTMQRLGYNISIYCLDHLGPLAAELQDAGIDVREFSRRGGWLDLVTLRKLLRQLRDAGTDLVHTHNYEAYRYGTLAAKLARVPRVVHTEHEIFRSSSWKRKVVTRFLGRLVDGFIGVSEAVSQSAVSQGLIDPCKLLTISNGIDTEKFHPCTSARAALRTDLGIPQDSLVGICVANLGPIKGHSTLLKGFKEVVDTFSNAHLILVGDGPLKKQLAQEVHQLGLKKNVRMLGQVREVERYLRLADLFVMTSLSEGLSVSLLEGMASGLIPVVTTVGGNVEIVRNAYNGILVPPNDPGAFAAAVKTVANDAKVAAQMSERARKTVIESFSEEKMIRKYDECYKITAAGHANPRDRL